MSDKLNNVSFVTLALIGKGGASPHDLVDMLRRGGDLYYAVAPSRLYAEPKRLEELGYVTSVKRPGKTREKTFYTLTKKGLAALRRWTLEPPATPRIQNEAIPKLLSGDITGDDARLLETPAHAPPPARCPEGATRRGPHTDRVARPPGALPPPRA